MKKHIFSLLLIVLSFALNAQNDRLGANLFGIIVTPVSGDTFQVEGNYNDPSGVTDGNDLAIGDVLWTVGANSGDTCRVMEITDIITAFAGYVVFEVDANGQGAPSTQNSKLMRLTPDNNLAYVPQQGNEGLIECISQYFAFQLDAGTGGGGTIETIVAGTGISVDATDPANPIVTNTAPDQTVSITGAGSVAVTGTYPNFTATGSGITGSFGAAGRVAYFTGDNVIGNDIGFFYNATNNRLGVGTDTPSYGIVSRGANQNDLSARIASQAGNTFALFSADYSLSTFPRASFFVGTSAADVNTGMSIRPLFATSATKPNFLFLGNHVSFTDDSYSSLVSVVTDAGNAEIYTGGVSNNAPGSLGKSISMYTNTTSKELTLRNGRVGIRSAAPEYMLHIGQSTADASSILLFPHDNALTGTEGLFFAHNASNHFKGHDGTSLYRFPKYSDVAATDGQIAVYNSATDRWVPTTIATLLNTQTNYQIDVSETEAGTNFRTVYGGDSEAAVGITQDGSDAAIVQLSVYNSSTNLKSLLTLSEGEASLEGAVARVKGTDVVVNSNLSDITMIALGAALKQTGFVIDDTSAIRVIATTAPNFAGIQYSSSAVRDKFTDLSLTDKGYVLAQIAAASLLDGSGFVPDNTDLLTSDGAGVTFGPDFVNLQGAEIQINGTAIRTRDTIVVPIYDQYDAAPTADNDYRGWRTPALLNGDRIIGIQYSFDTAGSGDVLIQLGNGTVNIGGATIPTAGYVDVSANRVLVTGEKWTPDIASIAGTGHLGLMVNLIIEKS